MGKGLTGIGAAAAAGFGVAVKSAADFEKTLSAVGAVLGVPRAGMEGVRELALEMGRSTKFSAQEVVQGMEDMAKAGLTIKQITGGATQGVIALASAAGDMKLDQAAEIAVNAMKTFNLPADQLTHVADVMAGAANASTVEVEDLAVSLRYVGAVAKTVGLNIDDTNTALALLADRGIKGSTAGTSLRGVLLSLSPTSKKAAAMMKELGLITEDGKNQFFDAKGNMKDFGEVMQILGDHTKNLSQEQRNMAFNVIFQRRAMAAAQILAEQGSKGFDDYAKAIGRVSAADVASAKLDNLAGDMTILKTSIQTMLIEAGTPFQDQLREWVQRLTDLVNAFGQLSPETQKNIMKILAYTGAIFTAMGGMSLFIGQILKFVSAMQKVVAAAKFINSFMPWVGILGKLKSGFETLRIVGMYAIEGIQSALATLLANPVVLIVAAVVALGVALFVLYKKWQPFHDLVDETWQSFQVGWDMLLNFAKDLGGKISRGFSSFVETLRNLREDVGNVIGGVIEWFQLMPGRIVNYITKIPGRIMAVLDSMWDSIYQSVSNGIGATVNFFATLPERVAYWLAFMVGRAIRIIAQFMISQVQLVHRGIDETVGFFEALPGRIIGFLNMVWDGIYAFGNDVVNMFKELPGKVIAFVNEWWDSAYARTVEGMRVIKENVLLGFDAVVEFFRLLPGRVIGFVNQLWDESYANFMRGKDIVIGVVKQWFDNTIEFFKLLPGRVVGAVNSLWDGMWNFFLGLGARAYDGAVAGFTTLLNFFKELPGKVLGAIGNLASMIWEKMKSVGSSAWEGFKKGLFGSPKTKIQYALEDLLDYTKTFNYDMGSEMAKLSNIAYDKLGPSMVGAVAAQSAVAGAGTSAGVTNNTWNDKINISGADQKQAIEISRDIMYQKRVRLYT